MTTWLLAVFSLLFRAAEFKSFCNIIDSVRGK